MKPDHFTTLDGTVEASVSRLGGVRRAYESHTRQMLLEDTLSAAQELYEMATTGGDAYVREEAGQLLRVVRGNLDAVQFLLDGGSR